MAIATVEEPRVTPEASQASMSASGVPPSSPWFSIAH
jgi:hypothetical protein